MVGDLLALNLLLSILAFLVAVTKKYSRWRDPIDEAGAAAIAMAMPVGIIAASVAYNESLYATLGFVLSAVEAIWFVLTCGEGSAE